MLKFYCIKDLVLYKGINSIGFVVENIDESTGEVIPLMYNPLVTCNDIRVNVSDYSILKLDSTNFTIGDSFSIDIMYEEEMLTEAFKVIDIFTDNIEEELIPEDIEVAIEEQILEGVNLLIELQADIIGGSI